MTRSLRLGFFGLGSCLILVIWFAFGNWNITGKSTGTSSFFQIRKGDLPATIAASLQDSGYIQSAGLFKLAGRISGKSAGFKAGFYSISGNESVLELLTLFEKGQTVTRLVTIPEGLPARRIAGLLKHRLGIDSLEFMKLFADTSLLRLYGIKAPTFEGYLLPETHEYELGTSTRDVFLHLVKSGLDVWADSSLTERLKAMKLTRHQAMTMASIVEGEARLAHEREIISGLYWNRIKRRIPLQADPTIQYIIKDGPRRILYKDLEIDSPYNTYRNRGLPPGPISNPGRDAIYATLNPAIHDFIFMVADGKGGHIFTRTLEEHAIAKDRYDKIMAPRRQEMRRKQANGS